MPHCVNQTNVCDAMQYFRRSSREMGGNEARCKNYVELLLQFVLRAERATDRATKALYKLQFLFNPTKRFAMG